MSPEPDGPSTERSEPPRRPTTTPLIPDRATDDTDVGWGEREQNSRDEDILRERPPHW